MTADIQKYFKELTNTFLLSPIIKSFQITREWQSEEEGYLRAKCILITGDLIEVSEYMEIVEGKAFVQTYTFHWQKANGSLVKRWDNVKHHEEIETFPCHIHDGEEGNVKPSEPMNHQKILKIIQSELEKDIEE